jgi:hypothetical protein
MNALIKKESCTRNRSTTKKRTTAEKSYCALTSSVVQLPANYKILAAGVIVFLQGVEVRGRILV